MRNRPARTRIRNDLAQLNSLLNALQLALELRISGVCVAITGFKMDAPLESLLGFSQLKLYPLTFFKPAIRRGSLLIATHMIFLCRDTNLLCFI